MARGITASDIHSDADELVAAGELPTVERIRAHLGTGSPIIVTRCWRDYRRLIPHGRWPTYVSKHCKTLPESSESAWPNIFGGQS